MVNIQDLFDDAKCYQTIRDMRWPDGVACPQCSSDSVIKNGRDDPEPHRQRYECRGCRHRFDDLTDTIFAGHHQPLRTWIACLYLMGLNLSGLGRVSRALKSASPWLPISSRVISVLPGQGGAAVDEDLSRF